jgi:carbamoyltransferase
MFVLGINAYHGDVSAAIVRDGALIAAIEEERFRRIKHWAGFPADAIRQCLAMAGATGHDVDAFAVSRDPRAHRVRKVLYVLGHRPNLALITDRARNQRRIGSVAATMASTLNLDERHVRARLHYVEHHPAHLASSFFVSGFDEATVVAIDGFGDFVSTSVARGARHRVTVLDRVYFPHSLGMLYLAVTQYLGFPNYGDEFKVMGLAPYGEPAYVARIRQLLRLEKNGRFQLDLSYFRHASEGVDMTWEGGAPAIGRVFTPKLEALLGPARNPGDPLTPTHEAVAASLQQVYEEAAFHVLRAAYDRTKLARLCLAGGCAMNSVANGKIREQTGFREVFIQPAAGDNGTALGAAFHAWHASGKRPRAFVMQHSLWGPAFDNSAIATALDGQRTAIAERDCTRRQWQDASALDEWTAVQIAAGRVVGWFQGRMEWGARALGNRSIVADPRRADMREIITTRIKFRERFRPFAPSVLEEVLDEFFVRAVPDPYMLQVYPVRPDKRTMVPAITHVDGSGRLQTVSAKSNRRYYDLIRAFQRLTGVGMVLNTSFNENEPIVHTPEQALDCFLRTSMDVLVMGNHSVERPHAERR